jgi:hypothetical protein
VRFTEPVIYNRLSGIWLIVFSGIELIEHLVAIGGVFWHFWPNIIKEFKL